MKDTIKLISVILAGLIAAAIPLTGFYLVWSWCIAQVPMVYAWAGLAKIGITLALVLVGGGATIGLTILAAGAAGTLVAALLD